MKRWELSILLGMVMAVIFSSIGVFGSECAQVRAQVLRLHVLAHSDSDEDQELKLAVRDAVLAKTAHLFALPRDKDTLIAVTRDHLEEMEAAAREEIRARGFDYGVTAQVVRMYFETREYDGVTLPAGEYDAVRLLIGAGQGRNWWCVMFPPLCIPAAADTSALPLEEQLARLGQTPQYVPKFAIVELIESWAR